MSTISVDDVLHTLRECERNVRYEGMFDHMLTFASELTGISEDTLYSSMYQEKTLEAKDNTEKSYFDIHVTYGPGDGDGYSVFVELAGPASEQNAIEKAKKEELFEEPEDIHMIDSVDEIDEDMYLMATGRNTISLEEKIVHAQEKQACASPIQQEKQHEKELGL